MVTSLIHHERIMTTTAKAKELRKVADNVVTYAKKGNRRGPAPIPRCIALCANRAARHTGLPRHRTLAGAVVREQSAMVKLFEILGPRYK